MRTQKEIVDYLNSEDEDGIFSFRHEVLVPFLTFENAKPFLKEGVTDWKCSDLSRDSVLSQMRKYMEFAWGKVLDHRGLSANRSVSKMKAWRWLLGDSNKIEWRNYPNYGAPILAQVCELYSFNVPIDENLELMIEGKNCKSCSDGTTTGCGR